MILRIDRTNKSRCAVRCGLLGRDSARAVSLSAALGLDQLLPIEEDGKMKSAILLGLLLTGCSQGGTMGSDPDLASGGDAGGVDLAAPDLAAPDLAAGGGLGQLSDEFTGAALDPSWQVFRPSAIDISVSDGRLHIAPRPNALWFDTQQGGLVYKVVTGDFRLTAKVRAHVRNMPYSTPPTAGVQLAGLVARAPVADGAGAQEDYVFIVVGFDVNDLSVEHKSTDNGSSSYQGPPWSGGEAELRICRIGSMFYLYKRMIGAATWTPAMSYTRPDLPAALQVGVTSYTNRGAPDVVGSFDSVDFAAAPSTAACTAD